MSKIYGATIIALIISVAAINGVMAKEVRKVECEVRSVAENVVTLTCDKNSDTIETWKKVKVMQVKKRAKPEGC